MTSKTDARQQAAARRRLLADPAHAAALAAQVGALALAPGAVVAGYAAFRDEADPALVLDVLAGRGHPLALPALIGKGLPLTFRCWRRSDALVIHPYGMAEPHPDCPEVTPDVLLVPLLAFDAEGYRLGYGGGYYDRTLETLRAGRTVQAIGIAYAGQKVAVVPHSEHDQRLDAVLTEAGLTRFDR
jgi:5-formyltetrahydrofolate cyclo-ligase